MPFMLGSTYWDLAVTTNRVLAIERPILGLHDARKTISIPLQDIDRIKMKGLPFGIAMLYVELKNGTRQRFKISGRGDAVNHVNESLKRWQSPSISA